MRTCLEVSVVLLYDLVEGAPARRDITLVVPVLAAHPATQGQNVQADAGKY